MVSQERGKRVRLVGFELILISWEERSVILGKVEFEGGEEHESNI